MKKVIKNIKEYVRTAWRLVRYKKKVIIHIKKDKTFGLTYFNMSEVELRQYLQIAFTHFAYNQMLSSEINEMTK